ncbi:rRNA bioproteinsis protein rrp36 [Rhizopus azygosporus]|uniref:rRNA biogenesis protein RRP36 n=1 Tax=Rhizopus azygosporus TaxID=86630 RepID=A0A367J638_RHIAZ|nr:rRNA bioproteinsis protein rrp36 [Rhizopus azygosporus]
MARKHINKPIESESEQEEYDQSEQEYDESEEEEFDENEQSESENEEEEDESEIEDDENDRAAKIAKMKRDLAHVSFEQLAEINNKMGVNDTLEKRKVSKAQILKDLEGAVSQLKKKDKKLKKSDQEMKRESKHRPMEMSSKRAVTRLRTVVPLQAEKRRDPRFDKLSGHFNQDLFEKSYGFLEEYRKSEIDMLKERIKKERDPETAENLKMMLTKMVSSEKTKEDRKRKQELIRQRKKQEAELVKQGKKPYFLKRSEKRKLELMDRYQRLGDKAVDRILEKRRKKNSSKDKKKLPFKRRSAAE